MVVGNVNLEFKTRLSSFFLIDLLKLLLINLNISTEAQIILDFKRRATTRDCPYNIVNVGV